MKDGSKEVTGRRGRRRKQLLYDLKEKRYTGNWKMKHEIAFYAKLAFQEATDLSQNRLIIEWIYI
jgi:hypothetical protein